MTFISKQNQEPNMSQPEEIHCKKVAVVVLGYNSVTVVKMYKWWLVVVLVATVATSASGSSAVEKTCTDLKNSVQKTSLNFAP